jgi:muramoyltetrapeptide carboxypeptidase
MTDGDTGLRTPKTGDRRLRRPKALKQGDRVAIVAPASPFARDEFQQGVAELERLGFVPVFDDTVFARASGYLAGSADVRAAAFMRYWADPAVSALMAARGGFGSVHILPLLDRARVMASPKLFIGYSDNTSLLSYLTCQCGLTALHGPMIEGRLAGGAGYDRRSFLELICGASGLLLAPEGLSVVRAGDARGVLFGGTLTQLVASLGTPFAFDPPDGCVLFIEDVNERPFRLDRMLTQLRLSGILARAVALVFGEMRGCDEPGGEVTAAEVIARLTSGFEGPVIVGFPAGHSTGPVWSLPLGVTVQVSTRPRPAILVEEAPVE